MTLNDTDPVGSVFGFRAKVTCSITCRAHAGNLHGEVGEEIRWEVPTGTCLGARENCQVW